MQFGVYWTNRTGLGTFFVKPSYSQYSKNCNNSNLTFAMSFGLKTYFDLENLLRFFRKPKKTLFAFFYTKSPITQKVVGVSPSYCKLRFLRSKYIFLPNRPGGEGGKRSYPAQNVG